jgi:hypothetical protein
LECSGHLRVKVDTAVYLQLLVPLFTLLTDPVFELLTGLGIDNIYDVLKNSKYGKCEKD